MTRTVRPLEAGASAVGISVGGPFIANLGAPLPMPLTAVYGRYGLDGRTDVDVGLHLPVARAAGLDLGAARLVWAGGGAWPAWVVAARVLAFGNAAALVGHHPPGSSQPYALAPRAFEQLAVTASWRRAAWLHWTGVDALLEVQRGTLRPAWAFGSSWRHGAVELAAEGRLLAFDRASRRLALNYPSLAGYGAWGLQLGVVIHLPAPTARGA